MNKKISLITAAMLHILALIYVCVMDIELVQTHEMAWDSELGHIMLTPAVLLIVYGWLLTIIMCWKLPKFHSIPVESRVSGDDGDWSAKAVLVLDKFHHSGLYQLFNTNR